MTPAHPQPFTPTHLLRTALALPLFSLCGHLSLLQSDGLAVEGVLASIQSVLDLVRVGTCQRMQLVETSSARERVYRVMTPKAHG